MTTLTPEIEVYEEAYEAAEVVEPDVPEPDYTEPVSIYAKYHDELWRTFKVTLAFNHKLLGGIPKDPKIVASWLQTVVGRRFGVEKVELDQMWRTTLTELGYDVPEGLSGDALKEMTDHIAVEIKGNGFKRNHQGIYIENRQIKAMLRETVNVLYAGEKGWGNNKSPKAYFVERVFIEPRHVHVAVEPDGTELVITHVKGLRGPQNSITHVEYANRPTIEFEVQVLRECKLDAKPDGVLWRSIWLQAEKSGLGACRSQGYGTFVVTQFEPTN